MKVESAKPSSAADNSTLNWMLIDMNSYFASVEQHLRPELRGRRVAVIPVESEYTCVIAASYDAKRCGVKVGTRVKDARRLCPGIVLVKARPNIYVQIHHAILRSVDKCLPVHKVYSIDEWAIRLLGDERKPERAIALGRRIKQQLLQDFSLWLTCSIGIAPTRLLAKIASELKKPDGLTVLDPGELPDKLDHLSFDDLCGIGQGMRARLNAHGIHSVRDLWAISKQRAIEVWGSVSGGQWWAGFHGYDEPELSTRRRSMSHANVLDPKFRNDEGAYGIMVRLLCRLGARLRHDGYFAHHLQVHLTNVRGSYWREEIALPCVQDTPALLEKFQKLWQQRTRGNDPPIKVGVGVAGLVPATQVSRPLFTGMEKPRDVSLAIDKINRRWGSSAVYFGSMHAFRHQMDDKIALEESLLKSNEGNRSDKTPVELVAANAAADKIFSFSDPLSGHTHIVSFAGWRRAFVERDDFMEETTLRRAIRTVQTEARQALDPQQCGLMDYTDLQRIIGGLSRTLQLAERAYDDLKGEYEELSERLKRSPPANLAQSPPGGRCTLPLVSGYSGDPPRERLGS